MRSWTSAQTGYRFVVKFGDDTADGVFASQTKYEEVKERVRMFVFDSIFSCFNSL